MATEPPQPSIHVPEISGLGRADASDPDQYPDSAVYARDVLSAYNSLRVFEGDFDRAQGLLRTIASAWLLSGIGAIGYLVIQQASYHPTTGTSAPGLMPAVAEVLRQLTFFLVSLGICSIWRIDQKVYQKLLHSVFALGYWIEFSYLCVPPARMMLYHSSYDITDELGEFYRRPVFVIFTCAILNFIISFFNINSDNETHPIGHLMLSTDNIGTILCAVVLIFHFFYYIRVSKEARVWGSLDNLLPPEAQQAKEDAYRQQKKGAHPPLRRPLPKASPAAPP